MSEPTNSAVKNAGWNFDNSYSRLPSSFFVRVSPVPVAAPRLVILNRNLAGRLGMNVDALCAPEGIEVLAGTRTPPGSDPLAQAYAGHQFGHFTMLGDGRAILLGEQLTPSGERYDIQLKGSGQTPFSRAGDGRAPLGPMLREHIISEAMFALGIPTSRSLAVVATGEPVYRETVLPGGILTRVASSHLRVGTFEYVAARGDREELQLLADYCISRHYPALASVADPYPALLEAIIIGQAELLVQWQLVGFIHGVMNTDNTTLSGETIDYGPCAFMDAYDPATVFSSIDHHGRYAYANQPPIAQWNLARLAESMLPLIAPDPDRALAIAQEKIAAFTTHFRQLQLTGWREKLGLFNEEAGDETLIEELLAGMQRLRADFTNTFRALADGASKPDPLFEDDDMTRWQARWQARLERQPQSLTEAGQLMRSRNPAVIPRNHRVEEALAAAGQEDYQPLERLLSVLAKPYDDTPEQTFYRSPAPPSDQPYRTFCGT
ncbi:MAG: YdiU family protein [Desulfuromonadales bacterium]